MSWLLKFTLVSSLIGFFIAQPAQADTYYWDTSSNSGIQGGGGPWNSSSWSSSTSGDNPLLFWPPGNNDANFYAGYGGSSSINLSGNVEVGNITFDGGGYTLSGGQLMFRGAVAGGGFGTIFTNQDATISSAIRGSLVKSGNGTLTLTGPRDAYDTIVSQGTLLLGSPVLLANSTVNMDGGVLSFGTQPMPIASLGGLKGSGNLAMPNASSLDVGLNNQSTTYSGVLSGNGVFSKSGNGNLTLSGENTFSGQTTVFGGVLTLGNPNALQNSTLDYNTNMNGEMLSFGTLTSATLGGLQGGNQSIMLVNVGNAPVALTVGNNNQSTTYSGQIYGIGASLTKVGNGTLTLSGPCDVDTILSQGTLLLGSPDALAKSTVNMDGGILSFGTLSSASLVSLGGLKGSGNLAMTNSVRLLVGAGLNNQSTTYSGVLSGNGIFKLGGGTLTLSGENTFSGQTAVLGGVLTLGNPNALQNSTLNYNSYGGVLSFGTLTSAVLGGLQGSQSITLGSNLALTVGNNNQSTTYSGQISGPGASLTKVGNGTLTLSGVNTHTGDTIVSQGTLLLGSPDALANSTVNMDGGVLSFGTLSSASLVSLGGLKGAGNLAMTNAVRLRVGAGLSQSTTYSGVLSGNGIFKLGGGTLTLSGENTFSGQTAVLGGVLTLGNPNALQNSTLDYNLYGGGLSFGTLTSAVLGGLQGSQSIMLVNVGNVPVALTVGNNNQSTAYSGQISGPGASLTKVGSGTLTLSGICDVDTIVSQGTLLLGAQSVLANSTVNMDGGVLSFGTLSSASLVSLGGLKGSGNLTMTNAVRLLVGGGLNNQSTTYSGALSGSGIFKLGGGTLNLSGENTFSGQTAVLGGVLTLGNPNALQNSTLDYNLYGGVLSFGTLTNATLGGLQGIQSIMLVNVGNAPVALTVGNNNQSTTYSGQINGPGASWTKVGSGTLTLSGTCGVDTIMSQGTLLLGNTGALAKSTVNMAGGVLSFGTLPGVVSLGGLKGSGNLAMPNASSLDVGLNNQSTTYSGVLSGNGVFSKSGSGTLTLSGENTFSGQTAVFGGVLTLSNPNALQNSTLDYNYKGVLSFGTLTSATLGGLQGSQSIMLASNLALTVGNNNQSTTYSGPISGSGASLTKVGSGTLTLSGTCDVDTIVSQGTLLLGAQAVLANSTMNMDGGVLSFGTLSNASIVSLHGLKGFGNLAMTNAVRLRVGAGLSQSTTYSGVLSGNGIFELGGGTLTLSGENTFSGQTVVGGGVLTLGNPNALQNSTLDYNSYGGVLSFGTLTSATLGGLQGSQPITLVNVGNAPVALTVGNNNQSTTYSGQISGIGASLTKVGSGTLTLSNMNSYSGGTVISQGTLNVSGYALNGGGNVQLAAGATLSGSGLVRGNIKGLAGSTILALGNLTLGDSTSYSGFNQVGTLAIGSNNVTLNSIGFANLGVLTTLGGGTLAAPNGVYFAVGSNLVGSGVINSSITGSIGSSITATGNLSLGDSTSYTGFSHAGTLDVGSNSVTLGSKQYANLGVSTTLSGGTINALKGISLGVGCVLSGSGAVHGKTAAGFGSTINATGNLTLGDSISLAGFASNGELYTNGNLVTLYSMNQAVLGSLTQIGDDGNSGTLVAAKGIVLNYGNSLVGQGTVSTPNTLAAASIINGNVDGTGSGLTFTGYIKGEGSFNGQLTINGTLDLNAVGANVSSLTGSGTVTHSGNGSNTLSIGSGDFSGTLGNNSGTLALLKTGNGQLVLSGTNTYTGGTTVNAGTLILTSASALPNGYSLTVGAGGTLIFDPLFLAPTPQNMSYAVSSMTMTQAVPEPSSLTLLGVGMIGLLGWAWRRRGRR